MRFFKIRDKELGKDILHVWEEESMFCNVRIEQGQHGPEIRITSPGFLTDRYEVIDKNFDEWHWCKTCGERVYWRGGPVVGENIFDGENYWHAGHQPVKED